MPKSVHDPVYKELISGITAARVASGLTQQAVAEQLGLPQSYVAKVEGCERRLDVVELLRLAKSIGVDPMPLVASAWLAVKDGRDA